MLSFKIHTISQICNVELFKIKLLSSEIKKYEYKYGKILTYIGGLGKIHNISYWIYLISRLNKINQSKFSLLIIGSGPDKIYLENLSKKFKLKNVHFFGQIPKNSTPFWLNLSYATLFSTTNLPVQQTCAPNKVFDSFSAGIPLIQTSTGWIKDFVEKTNCGISIKLDNIEDSAVKVSEYLNNPKIRDIHSINSFNNSKIFDKHLLADKYLNLLNLK